VQLFTLLIQKQNSYHLYFHFMYPVHGMYKKTMEDINLQDEFIRLIL
jgi:hypothetical protein